MSTLERVRASGKCSPSLLRDDIDSDFETTATKVVDANGTSVVRLFAFDAMETSGLTLYCMYSFGSNPLALIFLLTVVELYLSSEPTVPDDFKKLLEVR